MIDPVETPRAKPSPTRRRPRRVRRQLRRGVYLLPSLFTTGNVLLGFFAVVQGYRGNFETAALLIFIAGFLDSLDGRIARLMGTESEFGFQYDSLADVLTFGSAPAVLAFLWGLHDFGRIGWLVPLFFLLCTAIRLARFNVKATITDSRFFVGLPSPAAAGAIASFLFIAPDSTRHLWLEPALMLTLIAVGSLMVSTFRYPSMKRIDLRRRWSYRTLVPLATGILILALHPPAFFLSVAIVYTLVGPLGWLIGRVLHRWRKSPAQAEPAEAP